MAQYRIHDPEDLLECPYDRVHMVRAKRMQYHLMKCRKNYTGKEFEKCPFNAKHHVPKPEFRHHLANCPDKAFIEPEIKYNQRRETGDNTLKGCTDTPVYRELDIPSSEDWEAEASAPVRVGPRYDNTYYDRVQFKDLSGMTKVQKAIVADGRLTTQQKMEELAGGDRQMTEDIYLRLPKTASKVAMSNQPQIKPKDQPVSSVFAYSTSRGRGRGLAQGVTPGGQLAPVSGAAGTFMPTMPYGRGMGGQPSGAVGVGRGMVAAGGIWRGHVAPPPGFCVPKVPQAD